MTILELIEKLRNQFASKDVSTYPNFLAIQINIKGANEGVFYIEIKDGALSIEPYEYHDRNAAVTISMDNFLKILNKKLDPVVAFTLGKLKINGDVSKVLELTKLI